MARFKDVDVCIFLATPGAPTVVDHGTPGLVAYSYKVVHVDSHGGETAASAAGSTSTGAASLNGTDFERITFTAPTNAASSKVYRTVGGATQGLIATTTGSGAKTVDDTGLVADGSTASASNGTGLGTPMDVSDMQNLTLQTSGTFVGTIQIQGAVLAGQYVSEGSAITGAGVVAITPTYQFIRAKMTAYTSGLPVFTVGGHISK